jgi:hypothetical protein
MCLYPKLILNRKYKPNKKNNYNPPPIKDKRAMFVPVGCGKCMECLKQKSREWRVRLIEEIISGEGNIQFITLSYSDKSLIELEKAVNEIGHENLDGYNLDNQIAKLSIRRFLERWRKQTGKSCKHWIVSELGQTRTERLHLHGLLWTSRNVKEIEQLWKYGNVWAGDYVNEKTINYIVKYIYKQDQKHKYYKPVILTSPGIGSGYLNRPDSKLNKFKGSETNVMYKTRSGIKLPLPIYYRNHIYTDEEKEELWMNILDKETRYVNGIKVDISETEEHYEELLKDQRIRNKELGFGNDEKNWDEIRYEKQRRYLKKLQRIKKENALNRRNQTPTGRS